MTAARTARAMTKACPTNSANGTNKLSTSESHHDSARSRPSCCASSACCSWMSSNPLSPHAFRSVFADFDIWVKSGSATSRSTSIKRVASSQRSVPSATRASMSRTNPSSAQLLVAASVEVARRVRTRSAASGLDAINEVASAHVLAGAVAPASRAFDRASTFGSSRRSASSCTASSRAAFRSASVNAESSARSAPRPPPLPDDSPQS